MHTSILHIYIPAKGKKERNNMYILFVRTALLLLLFQDPEEIHTVYTQNAKHRNSRGLRLILCHHHHFFIPSFPFPILIMFCNHFPIKRTNIILFFMREQKFPGESLPVKAEQLLCSHEELRSVIILLDRRICEGEPKLQNKLTKLHDRLHDLLSTVPYARYWK
jgi:hypothetical protein